MNITTGAALVLSFLLIAAGCAQTPKVAETASVEPAPKALPGLSPSERLRRGLSLLEDGDEATARAELVIYQSRTVNSSLARSLLRQIDTSPEEYFPAEFREVILRKGQSLSNIAKDYLGSAIEFHALAKYNDIEQPRRMFPGQIVKIPLTSNAREAFAELEDALDEPSLEGMPLAESLQQSADAAEDAANQGDEFIEESANSVASEEAAEATDQNASVAAAGYEENELPEAAEREQGSTVAIETVGASVDAADAATVAEVAEVAEAEAEIEMATLATAQDAVPPPVDVDALHRRAINAYRAQDLDTAISLWNEVLEADPSYEGARLYRSQALALRKRLNSFK